ncbi:hypothetical protein MHA_1042 [Mannheimia haemolytica PHL213]|nr:hypothetical protein [Mannheimia haemolytica]AGK00875.1 hypothetical protein MHH_c03870 [Mannheimia haemolytica M42548]EDN73982.1 hypothetical protein MHA_1042 [Mannheimia haemolytica PHL213]EEY09379.1 hypothetical protein COI_1992 [Mannheimia haemolytica serotype A2 str. OVINE]EEY13540.1 hypothetical protein COK_0390 [Mannheimia haemolytica serotype A2 str. BOVINE]MDW0540591.1 hypothetical protein [Mannheimia haemolytica]
MKNSRKFFKICDLLRASLLTRIFYVTGELIFSVITHLEEN